MKKILLPRFLLGAVLGAAAFSAQAQVSYGPRVGFNLANVSYDVKTGDAPETKVLTGAQLGVMLHARFGKLAVQPAVLFSQKGYKVDYTERTSQTDTVVSKGTFLMETTTSTPIKGSLRLNYVEIPVNLVYTTGEDHGFQLIAGPYVGFGIGGKAKVDATSVKTTESLTIIDIPGGQPFVVQESSDPVGAYEADVKFKSDVKETDDAKYEYYSTPDFGLNFGVGYLKNRFQVQALYGLGLKNILPEVNGKTPDDTAKNRVIQLTVGYLFGASTAD